MNWKKSILSIAAVISFIGVMLGIFGYSNSRTEKIIRNEMNTQFNKKTITEAMKDIKIIVDFIPQFKILVTEIPDIKKQIEKQNEILRKVEFIVLKNQEDCPEDDEECDRLKVEQYVKRR